MPGTLSSSDSTVPILRRKGYSPDNWRITKSLKGLEGGNQTEPPRTKSKNQCRTELPRKPLPPPSSGRREWLQLLAPRLHLSCDLRIPALPSQITACVCYICPGQNKECLPHKCLCPPLTPLRLGLSSTCDQQYLNPEPSVHSVVLSFPACCSGRCPRRSQKLSKPPAAATTGQRSRSGLGDLGGVEGGSASYLKLQFSQLEVTLNANPCCSFPCFSFMDI